MAEACGGWSSILTSKMHESGQCGSPACLQQRERERERGSCTWQWAHAKLNLCRTHLRPMRNSIRHASGAAGSATATVTGNDKKRERKRNTKIKKRNSEKCIFTYFAGVIQSGPWSARPAASLAPLYIPVDHFSFRANIPSLSPFRPHCNIYWSRSYRTKTPSTIYAATRNKANDYKDKKKILRFTLPFIGCRMGQEIKGNK